MKTTTETRFNFDEFEVDAERRIMFKKGQPVALKPKAFDLLLALLEKRGSVVSKNDLLETVWENQFVEEKNLTVHIAALRKAFGEGKNENRFIVTVPGTGYKFVAQLNRASDEIVIETEKFERIVVEQEEDKNHLQTMRKASIRPKLFILTASILIVFVVIGGFFWQSGRQKSQAANSIQRLTTNGKVQSTALSPDGKLFIYVTNDLGQRSLWLGDTTGGNHIELRPAEDAEYGQLAFAPDSSQIYYSVRDARSADFTVYRMPGLGGVPEKIVGGQSNFSLSPDGRQIVFGGGSKDGRVSLTVLDLDTKTEREILSVPQTETFTQGSVSWSPDGARLAFSCLRENEIYAQDLCLAEISTKKIERIVLPNYRSILKTVWLKDNREVIVTATPDKNLSSVVNFQILRVEVPSGRIREVTNDLNTYNSDISIAADSESLLTIEHRQLANVWVAPAENLALAKQITFGSFGKYDGLWGLDWTPDGRLVFNNSTAETQHISVMNAMGTERRDLTSPGFMDSALTVSGDGRYIVFHSVRGGAPGDVWRMDIDGGNPKQLTFGKKNFLPSVSPDSRYVYYRSWINGIGELRRVPIDGGEPEILTDKPTGSAAFSPDGKFFAATYLTDKRRLAIFSVETSQIVKQFDLPKSAVFDVRPRWTPDSQTIVFRDSEYGFWSQSINGGEPLRLEGLPKERLYNFAWSKDGKQFAFVRGQEIRDVVLMTNFR